MKTTNTLTQSSTDAPGANRDNSLWKKIRAAAAIAAFAAAAFYVTPCQATQIGESTNVPVFVEVSNAVLCSERLMYCTSDEVSVVPQDVIEISYQPVSISSVVQR